MRLSQKNKTKQRKKTSVVGFYSHEVLRGVKDRKQSDEVGAGVGWGMGARGRSQCLRGISIWEDGR